MNNWDKRVVKVGVENTSGERIPPFAVLELDYTGTSAVSVDSAGEVIWKVKKPTSAGVSDRARILMNGPAWIEIDGYGSAILNPSMAIVLFNSATAPTINGSVGPVASQWYMSENGTGWLYKSDDVSPESYNQSSTIKSAYVELAGGGGGGASLYAARMTENWTSRQATCEIYTLDGANEPVYVDDQEVYDPLSVLAALGNGDWMYVLLHTDGKYYINPASCPGTSPLIADPPATQP